MTEELVWFEELRLCTHRQIGVIELLNASTKLHKIPLIELLNASTQLHKTPHSTLQWRTVEIADVSGPLIYCSLVINHVAFQRGRLFPVWGEKFSLFMCSSTVLKVDDQRHRKKKSSRGKMDFTEDGKDSRNVAYR